MPRLAGATKKSAKAFAVPSKDDAPKKVVKKSRSGKKKAGESYSRYIRQIVAKKYSSEEKQHSISSEAASKLSIICENFVTEFSQKCLELVRARNCKTVDKKIALAALQIIFSRAGFELDDLENSLKKRATAYCLEKLETYKNATAK